MRAKFRDIAKESNPKPKEERHIDNLPSKVVQFEKPGLSKPPPPKSLPLDVKYTLREEIVRNEALKRLSSYRPVAPYADRMDGPVQFTSFVTPRSKVHSRKIPEAAPYPSTPWRPMPYSFSSIVAKGCRI